MDDTSSTLVRTLDQDTSDIDNSSEVSESQSIDIKSININNTLTSRHIIIKNVNKQPTQTQHKQSTNDQHKLNTQISNNSTNDQQKRSDNTSTTR